MLSTSNKFPLRTSFLDFKKRAKKTALTNLLLYSSPSDCSRLGVVVPKKVNKLATTRNWLKRLTYDTLWPLIKDQKIDVVVVYRPLPLVKSPQTKEQIISQLNNSKLLY